VGVLEGVKLKVEKGDGRAVSAGVEVKVGLEY
jgi:hypothetical protein